MRNFHASITICCILLFAGCLKHRDSKFAHVKTISVIAEVAELAVNLDETGVDLSGCLDVEDLLDLAQEHGLLISSRESYTFDGWQQKLTVSVSCDGDGQLLTISSLGPPTKDGQISLQKSVRLLTKTRKG